MRYVSVCVCAKRVEGGGGEGTPHILPTLRQCLAHLCVSTFICYHSVYIQLMLIYYLSQLLDILLFRFLMLNTCLNTIALINSF